MRHLGNRGTEQYKYKIRGDPADAGTASNQFKQINRHSRCKASGPAKSLITSSSGWFGGGGEHILVWFKLQRQGRSGFERRELPER